MTLQRNLTLLSTVLALTLTAAFAQAAEHHKKVKKPAAQQSRLPETTNRYGITMVTLPAGSFVMGSCLMTEENKRRAFLGQAPDCNNPDSNASSSETPQHGVNIPSFQIGKTEVTLRQFKRFIADTRNTHLINDDFINYNNGGDDAPVVQVSWHDAQAFIDWLNQTEGGGYRLPSEAEWEYACRAGSYTTYCGSNSVDAVAWYDGNSGRRTHSVAQKQANAFGLVDMSGNVWEWVQDTYYDNYNGAPSDGSAWTGSGDSKVLRGGSWGSLARNTRAADRTTYAPALRNDLNGFRLARTLP